MAEFYIVWKVPFQLKGRVEDTFDDWKRHKLVGQNDAPQQLQQQQHEEQNQGPEQFVPSNGALPLPAKPFTIQQCLQFSKNTELLDEDHTWYCTTCKDNVYSFHFDLFV
jgi:hypothetical protein